MYTYDEQEYLFNRGKMIEHNIGKLKSIVQIDGYAPSEMRIWEWKRDMEQVIKNLQAWSNDVETFYKETGDEKK